MEPTYAYVDMLWCIIITTFMFIKSNSYCLAVTPKWTDFSLSYLQMGRFGTSHEPHCHRKSVAGIPGEVRTHWNDILRVRRHRKYGPSNGNGKYPRYETWHECVPGICRVLAVAIYRHVPKPVDHDIKFNDRRTIY